MISKSEYISTKRNKKTILAVFLILGSTLLCHVNKELIFILKTFIPAVFTVFFGASFYLLTALPKTLNVNGNIVESY